MKSKTNLYVWALPSIGGDKPFLGIPVKSQGRTTPPKQNLPPKNGFPQSQRGQDPPERVVTDFKNLHEKVNIHFYSTSMFVEYLGQKIVLEFSQGHFSNLYK